MSFLIWSRLNSVNIDKFKWIFVKRRNMIKKKTNILKQFLNYKNNIEIELYICSKLYLYRIENESKQTRNITY